MRAYKKYFLAAAVSLIALLRLPAVEQVYLTEVPDYHWHLGCFGTACGNLGGYWDRHGMSNLYTGPTNGGVAPVNSNGSNRSITALWASKSGLDGRPDDMPGHHDDYYVAYEFRGPDPYVTLGREEHSPDSIGDFIGLSQNKWNNQNGECDGNIDAYSFVFWDYSGDRRVNFTPSDDAGDSVRDIPSGLHEWTQWRGYQANTYSQLTEFNPDTEAGLGFTFEDLKAEINSGYPVLLYMQPFDKKHRDFADRTFVNPDIHGMLAYGYFVSDAGQRFVRFRTSWASGDNNLAEWNDRNWTPSGILNHPLRGVLGYHPLPQVVDFERNGSEMKIMWHGPSSELMDASVGEAAKVHYYVVEMSGELGSGNFEAIGQPTTDLEATVDTPEGGNVFFRVRLLSVDEVANFQLR